MAGCDRGHCGSRDGRVGRGGGELSLSLGQKSAVSIFAGRV